MGEVPETLPSEQLEQRPRLEGCQELEVFVGPEAVDSLQDQAAGFAPVADGVAHIQRDSFRFHFEAQATPEPRGAP